MTEIDPVRAAPEGGPTGDAELDQILSAIERSAEKEIERNATVLDNQLAATDRVIANVAALQSITQSDELLGKVLEAVCSDPP